MNDGTGARRVEGEVLRPPKWVLFDFDGTLADSGPWVKDVLNEVARRYKFRTIDDAEFEVLRTLDSRGVLRMLQVKSWKVPWIARHMRRRMQEDLGKIRLFPGAPELIGALGASGISVGIVSSNSEANVRALLGEGTAGKIQHFACGAGLFGKARKFRAVLRAVGAAPHEVWSIGDEVRDIEAARSVGLRTGAVSWGYTTAETLARHSPDRLFGSLSEVAPFLCGRPGESSQAVPL